MSTATHTTTAQQRADAARTAPFWPFAPLDATTLRHRDALQHAMRAGTLALAAGALLGLQACGGGDWPEDERATTGPVNCQATPEVCK